MVLSEALELLSDGHSVLSEEGARQVCGVFGVSFPDTLVMWWEDVEGAYDRYGFVPVEDGPGSGVACLDLSYHVASALGLGAPGSAYSGRGFQARANSRAIAEAFEDGEEEEE